MDDEGELLELKDSLGLSSPLDYSSSNKAVINIAKPDPDLIICESNYLHYKRSTPEAIINEFYITKILSNYPTKFIVTIKNSELKKEFLPLTKNLATLLKNVTLSSDSLSLVITNSPTHKNNGHISTTIRKIVETDHNKNKYAQGGERRSEKQEEIIKFLRSSGSLCIFPAFSPGTIDLDKFKNIFGRKFPPLIKENNKIAVGSADISDILTLQSSIKEGLRDGISKLSDKIKTKWEKEKASLFTLETKDICKGSIVQPNTEAVKKLQGIFKWLKKPGNDSSNNNIIDNDTAKFLALNNVLYNVLTDEESSELNVKLSSYIDYLKYFTAISVDNSNTNMHDNWFKMLADGVLSIGDINKQLVESFKTAMQDFFPCRLKAFLGELSNPTKILGEDTVRNIYSLKLLQSILADKDINNFTIIKHMLNITSPTNGVDLAVDLLKTNIAVLKKLVIERDPNYVLNILTERWQKFVDLKPIKEINEEIYNIIDNKLVKAEMPYEMDKKIYCKLLEVISLKDVGSTDLSDLHTKDCCPELVESYCKMGSGVFDGAELFESYNPPELMGTVGFA